MAALWMYQHGGELHGPLPFNDLVQRVREETLGTDDLVREDWNDEWRPAALAVGLFHMAGRQDLIDRWEAEQAERRRQEELAAAAAAQEEEASWQRRLREVEAEQAAEDAAAREEREAELAAMATETAIDEALAAALAEQDARERRLEPTRLERWVGRFAGVQTLHRLFRWGTALAVAGVAAAAILSWSETELQRLPDPEIMKSGVRRFPVWGYCRPEMYYFLLVDAALFAGAAAYAGARLLEQTVDD